MTAAATAAAMATGATAEVTSQEAFKVARLHVAALTLANVTYANAMATQDEGAQWDAMEAFNTTADALVGLLALLEERGVLADIQGYLEATYGRV